MPLQAALAVAAFVGMFVAWAVVPSIIRRRHAARVEAQESPEGR